MPPLECIAIVGVGLIGGSIGLAAQARKVARRVVGIGRRASSLRQARECGAVTETTTSLARGVRSAELVILCTPVEAVIPTLLEALPHCREGAILTDAASTKEQIAAALPTEWPKGTAFVPGHPIAGSEKKGPAAARSDLFEERTVVLTPLAATPPQAAEFVGAFWKRLGANVVSMSPSEHDTAMAAVSHLPHVLASALAAATPEELLPLVGSGWQDTCRVASGDVELWRQILETNRAAVLKSLDKFGKVLAEIRRALRDDDRSALTALLEAGKATRDSVGN